jgi:diguanylate cyclase (GGDEF)-like protein
LIDFPSTFTSFQGEMFVLYSESRRLGRSTTLGFLCIVLVIVIQSFFGAWKMNELSDELSQALVNYSDNQLEALKLKVILVNLRKLEKDILLSSEELQETTLALKRWQGELASAQQQLKQMELELNESGISFGASTLEFTKKLSLYSDGIQNVVTAIQQKRGIELKDAIYAMAAYKTHIYAMESALDSIVEQSEQHEVESIARLEKDKSALIFTMSFVSFIFIVLSSLLSLRVIRNSLKISRSIEHQSMHDPLTGVLNRHGLSTILSGKSTQGGVLLYLDFNRFKLINDVHGHVVGDEVLASISQEMNAFCHDMHSSLARVGGNEFVVWLDGEDSYRRGIELANHLLILVEGHSFKFLGHALHVGVSIGVARADPGFIFSEVMSRADAACRIAKLPGHAKVMEYAETDPSLLEVRSEERWASKIPLMLAQNKFCLYGQAILPMQSQYEHGHVEVLIHCVDENEAIPPSIFLPAAERFGLMSKIDQWVFDTFFMSELSPNVHYSLNISAHTLSDIEYLPRLIKLVQNSGKAQQIIFEITESVAITHIETAISYIRQLKLLGCRFSLDDFGRGFSSFAYLRDLDVDYLKIDGSLIRVLGRNESDALLVVAIVNMAQALGLKTIAEYVETPDLAILLTKMKLDFGQGYALHKPEPLAQAAEFVQKSTCSMFLPA